MTAVGTRVVNGKEGRLGMLMHDAHPSATAETVVLQLDTGPRVLVPCDVFILQADGSYFLPLSLGDLTAPPAEDEEQVVPLLHVPVLAEAVTIHTRKVETGRVRVTTVVHEHEETVDEPLQREEVHITHVPVGRFVESPPPQRHEGETTILPLVEEILVVEKRLFLREEVHVTTVRHTTHRPQQVRLRREEAVVERNTTLAHALPASEASRDPIAALPPQCPASPDDARKQQ